MTDDHSRMDAGEALAGACSADDEARPGWDYLLRMDSAQRMIESGVAASVAAHLYEVDQDKLCQLEVPNRGGHIGSQVE